MSYLGPITLVLAILAAPVVAQPVTPSDATQAATVWRVELRSGPAAPWALVGTFVSADDAKKAFVALPLGGAIEARIVTVAPVASTPVVVPPAPAPVIVEKTSRPHPTWYRFGYRYGYRTPLGLRLKHYRKHYRKREVRRPRRPERRPRRPVRAPSRRR